MRTKQAAWKWVEGTVDRASEHLELRYGEDPMSDFESWPLLALVGKPEGNVFPVMFVLKPKTDEERKMLRKAGAELDFYLVELGYEDPWKYGRYHCCTASNIYSRVHWSYFPHGSVGDRLASTVVRDKKGKLISIFKPTDTDR